MSSRTWCALLLLLWWVCPSLSSDKGPCLLYEGFRDSRCFTGRQLDGAVTDSSRAWIVEFYSSWCGHCHNFAPTWKKVATRIRGWSNVVQMGEMDCTQADNRDICGQYNVNAFPTIKLFKAREKDPHSKQVTEYVGRRSEASLLKAIVSHISSQESLVPQLVPYNSPEVDSVDILLFEEDTQSILGQEIILDFLSKKINIRRVLPDNVQLSRHYSILELPSLVILPHSDQLHHTVVSKSSAAGTDADIREHFEKAIREYVSKTFTGVKTDRRDTAGTRRHSSKVPKTKQSTTKPALEKVKMTDLLSTVSYILRYEVKLHQVIEGEAFYALHQFVYHMEKIFHLLNKSVSDDLRGVRQKLDTKYTSGFLTSSEWQVITRQKIRNQTFPVEPRWGACTGSRPEFRGFPCGLWTLMHTATVLSLNVSTGVPCPCASSREVLYAAARFVVNFFSCDDCRRHFSHLVLGLQRSPLSYDGDSVLWLWDAHNNVNKRLRDDPSSDPAHPKSLFPPYEACPSCYQRVGQGDALPDWNNMWVANESESPPFPMFVWNRTAVFLFLCNFYSQKHFDSVSHESLVHAGWPRKYPRSADSHYAHSGKQAQTPTSLSSLTALVYLLVAAILLWYFLNYRLKRTRFKSL